MTPGRQPLLDRRPVNVIDLTVGADVGDKRAQAASVETLG
jgi:hypothetical protein